MEAESLHGVWLEASCCRQLWRVGFAIWSDVYRFWGHGQASQERESWPVSVLCFGYGRKVQWHVLHDFVNPNYCGYAGTLWVALSFSFPVFHLVLKPSLLSFIVSWDLGNRTLVICTSLCLPSGIVWWKESRLGSHTAYRYLTFVSLSYVICQVRIQ